jgi:hypothetical protein
MTEIYCIRILRLLKHRYSCGGISGGQWQGAVMTMFGVRLDEMDFAVLCYALL